MLTTSQLTTAQRRIRESRPKGSADIGRIAGEYEHCLPWTFRYLTRGWGTRESRASDSIAMLLFEADYTRRLMDLGEQDGEARISEVEQLIAETTG